MSISEMDQSVFEANATQIIHCDDSILRRNLVTDFELATPMKAPAAEEDPTPTDHMKVYLRVRPLSAEEIEQKEDQGCMSITSKNMLEAKAPKDSHTYKNSQHGCGKQINRFTFSRIFGAETSQKEFFDDTVLEIVKDFIDGQNSLVFTYGVTNSGKTYTIQGIPKDGGILPRTLDVLFNSITDKQWPTMALKPKLYQEVSRLAPEQEALEHKTKEKVFKMAASDEPDMMSLLGDSDFSSCTVNSTMSQDSLLDGSAGRTSTQSHMSSSEEAVFPGDASQDDGRPKLQEVLAELDERVREDAAVSVEMQGQVKFSVWVSFSEIYNEQVFDLLEPIPKKKTAKRSVLQLREDKNGVPYVKGLKEICVYSADEAYKVLTIGKQNLQFAATKLNHNSSRSHCIFTIKVIRVVDKDKPHLARVSRLTFCDLAGAERSTKTQATGDRIKEAGNINTSLLALGRCIQMLRYNQQHKDQAGKIVPFRESKLTRLFQSFFCGQGKAAMIVNINQCASMFDETLHALRYSAVAKQVIVTQEPPKATKRPAPKSQRLLSLAASASKPSRDTMAWATPGTLAKYAEMEEDAVSMPLPLDDPDEDVDSDDTIAPDREKELIDLIYYLKDLLQKKKNESKADKKKIKELEKKCSTIEAKIRKEVVEEMSKQLVEMEAEYDEMISETKANYAEYAESRIEMYVEHYQKQQNLRKRRRVHEENEDDEMVSSIFLQRAELKAEELEKELTAVKAELDSTKAHLRNLIEERDDILKDNSKLQFDYASTRTVQERQVMHETEGAHQEDVIAKLSTEIEDIKAELEEKVKECSELSETLKEAGETFMQKEEELKELRAAVSDYDSKCKGQEENLAELQQLLEESRAAMVDAEQRLKSKQDYITELEQTSQQGNSPTLKSPVREGSEDPGKKLQELHENVASLLQLTGSMHAEIDEDDKRESYHKAMNPRTNSNILHSGGDDSGLGLTSNHTSVASLRDENSAPIRVSQLEPIASSTILSPCRSILTESPSLNASTSKEGKGRNLLRSFFKGGSKKPDKKKEDEKNESSRGGLLRHTKASMMRMKLKSKKAPPVVIASPSPPALRTRGALSASTKFTSETDPTNRESPYKFFAKGNTGREKKVTSGKKKTAVKAQTKATKR